MLVSKRSMHIYKIELPLSKSVKAIYACEKNFYILFSKSPWA